MLKMLKNLWFLLVFYSSAALAELDHTPQGKAQTTRTLRSRSREPLKNLRFLERFGPGRPGRQAAGFPEAKTIEKPVVFGAFGFKMLKNHWFLKLPC